MPRPRSLPALCPVGHTQRKADSKRACCSPTQVVLGGRGVAAEEGRQVWRANVRGRQCGRECRRSYLVIHVAFTFSWVQPHCSIPVPWPSGVPMNVPSLFLLSTLSLQEAGNAHGSAVMPHGSSPLLFHPGAQPADTFPIYQGPWGFLCLSTAGHTRLHCG